MQKSRIRPSLEYCSHIWGGAPKSTLCLLDKVQSRAIRLINNPNLTTSLQPLSHHRLAGDISNFTYTFTGIALRRSGILFLFLWSVSEPPETQFIHILSKLYCLIYEPYPTNHHSSLEHAICRSSCFLLAFPNLTTWLHSNLRSMNVIWSLSPLSLSLFSFFHFLGLV